MILSYWFLDNIKSKKELNKFTEKKLFKLQEIVELKYHAREYIKHHSEMCKWKVEIGDGLFNLYTRVMDRMMVLGI